MSTTGYAYASGQGFHVKLTRMGTAMPLPCVLDSTEHRYSRESLPGGFHLRTGWLEFRSHYRAGEACGVVGVRQSVWRQCDCQKKIVLLHRVVDLQSVRVNEVELLLMEF
ncbi:MAG: hypothetical protein RMY34_24155 [Aulosira sp. DedQUE10]|nr:hypothetical protein [Aulosira sp. DedQUE10]